MINKSTINDITNQAISFFLKYQSFFASLDVNQLNYFETKCYLVFA
jgi:hypothetical protein